MYFNSSTIIMLCFLSSGLLAQSTETKIRLMDLNTALPIMGATFEYGEQQGLSNEEGLVRFQFEEGVVLSFSHLNYGSWTLEGESLQRAIQQGLYYRESLSQELFPVTVIALRPQGRQPKEELGITYPDRLEHDGADILNRLPAFNSIRKGGNYGFDPVFRGFKYDQLNIVLNGAQSATAACPNRMDPPTSQMAPNMMHRIEVLKGPHALRYGTGLGATINFIPAQLRFSSEPMSYGRVSAGYESNGNLLRGETQVGISGNAHDISLFSSWSQGDDYTTGEGETVPADFSRGSFGTQLGLRLSARQQLRLSTTYNRARDADFPALPMDLRKDDTWLFNVRHDIQFNDRQLQSWNTTLFGSFVDHLMDNLKKPLEPRMLNASTSATTFNYGGRTEGIWQSERAKWFVGADFRIEGAEGTRVRTFLMGPNAGNSVEDNAWQDGRISKTGLFAEYQLKTTSLNYVFSGRFEFNRATVKDPSDEFSQVNPDTEVNQFNPSLSLGVMTKPESAFQLGVWLSRAQRSGSLTERFINYFPVGQDPYEMLGNPQLDPEVNNQVDLTLQWTPNRGTGLQLDLFASYLQEYISSVIDTTLSPRLPMSPGVRRYVNIDNAFKTGFELSWTQQLPAGLQHQLAMAYTYGQDLQREEPLPEIAPLDFRYSLTGSYFKDRLNPELTFRYVAEQSRISGEFGETVTPAFALVNIKIAYALSSSISLNVGVNNLLDEPYYEHLNRSVRGTNAPIFAPGRNVFFNLNWGF